MRRTKAALAAARAAKALDTRIETAFYAHCSGVQLNILDIPKVFAAGRAADAAGLDVDAAVITAVDLLRVN